MELRNRFKFIMMLSAVLCMPFLASCSDDDDEDDGGGSTSGEATMTIPSSIVDGVQVSTVSGGNNLNMTYNTDGTINTATLGNMTFQFVYEGSTTAKAPQKVDASATNGRDLLKIILTDGDDYSTYEATGFKFDSNTGFLLSFTENTKESYGSDEWEKVTSKYTFSYNSDGTLKSTYWEGKYSDSDGENDNIKATKNFTYSDGNLTKAEVKDGGYGMSMSFEYKDHSLVNKFNKLIPPIAAGLSTGESYITYIFAMTGYLGNGSKLLPTKFVERNWGPAEDGDTTYDENDTYTVSYTFDDKQHIKSIVCFDGTDDCYYLFDYLIYE